MAASQLQLPPDYYLTHFRDLLAVLHSRYHSVLLPKHLQLIEKFQQLPLTAQRLWVRLLNRKGLVFALKDVEYDEVPDQAAAVAMLFHAGLLDRPSTAEDLADWLQRANKEHLLELVTLAGGELDPVLPVLKKASTKPQIQQYIEQHQLLTPGSIQLWSEQHGELVALRAQTELQYLYFLYFGRFETSLTAFTLRDLGILPGSGFKQEFQARYTDRDQALAAFAYARLKPQLQTLQQGWKSLDLLAQEAALRQWQQQMLAWPEPLDDRTRLQREALCTALGRLTEKLLTHVSGDVVLIDDAHRQRAALTQLAIGFYQQSASYPASERLLRLFYANRTDPQMAQAMQQQLQQMLDNPSCDDELWFARDFASRKLQQKPTSDLTDFLRSAATITLDELYLGQTERGAVQYFKQQGYQAFHAENELWLGLFGLLLWQPLFESEQSAIYNEFERRPRDLTSGEFYQRQQALIEQQIALLDDPAVAVKQLLKTYSAQFQKANAVFSWHPDLAAMLPLLVHGAPAGTLSKIIRQMAQDFRRCSSGFPDLLLARESAAGTPEIQLVELKAVGDSLRRNQLTRLMSLREFGFAVSLMQVQWWQSPDRVYVVIDVETTGGKAENDRITDIAAYKVQYGEIIDEFSSLVNPQRRIPYFIQKLTGITNEMVASAPLFSEIAAKLSEFIGDSIFVAHNVNFDYGFVRAELGRCGYPLQLPKFCTVVQMRRAYPGLASYSLGKLAQHFEIPLHNHHRAAADARATVELLKLIQAKTLVGVVLQD
ncbi:DNA polymerase III subunit epsilon [Rheinheimera riviphila]|uniref:DNA-directed DNA polymerase n=1 Tax=Rheinheimera riviphila TaxID=1834037 RepID=A0A437QG61_9GAMM|nr:exonuclease domain-containing protein [Rheinheimera riviphila]RVU33492.1 DNA polymerase III subunit epsilon [Rheinheimera riviphila]